MRCYPAAPMGHALLEPVAAGQTRFRLQGLSPDARGIAVGRDALIVLESLERLVAFLGAYSEEASLDELVPSLTVERAARVGGGHALLLRCAAGDGYALDRLARLAGIARGQLFTGSGNNFVRTRERAAPFGYDLSVPIAELPREKSDDVVAVDSDYAAAYAVSDRLDPVDLLQRLALRPVPLPMGGFASDPEQAGLREMALLLAAPGVADRLLSYLWHQEVSFSGVRVRLDDDRKAALLLRLRQPPARLLDVLMPIPGVELLAPVSPRAAIEVGFRHPIHLASANTCLPGDEMYLFRGRVGRVERIDGAPRFVDGRHLVRSDARAHLREVGQLRPDELEPLRVELQLRPTSSVREPRASLIDWQQVDLLRRLVYLIPPSTLAASRVMPLPEGVLVIAGTAVGGRGSRQGLSVGSVVPIGRRMAEVAPGVLVPDGYELWPRVRPGLVRTLLGLEADDHAAFLGPERAPIRLRADQLLPLDAAVIGRLSLTDASSPAPELPPLQPGEVTNERVGRFALWGFRGDE